MPVRCSSFGFRIRIVSVKSMAGWQSGHAAACKAVYAGSIPTPASTTTPMTVACLIRQEAHIGSIPSVQVDVPTAITKWSGCERLVLARTATAICN